MEWKEDKKVLELQDHIRALKSDYVMVEKRLIDESRQDLEKAVEAYNNQTEFTEPITIVLEEIKTYDCPDKPRLLIGPDGGEAQSIYEQRVEMALDTELFDLLSPYDQQPLRLALNVCNAHRKYNDDLEYYNERMTKVDEALASGHVSRTSSRDTLESVKLGVTVYEKRGEQQEAEEEKEKEKSE